MNYDLIKKKMDKFFEETSPNQMVKEFEDWGYAFAESPVLPWNDLGALEIYEYSCKPRKTKFWQRSSHFPLKKLTSEYPGSFFLLKIAS